MIKKKSEEGIALVIVLVSVFATLLALKFLFMGSMAAEVDRMKIVEAFEDANRYRFVHQMIADDELCKNTDFMKRMNPIWKKEGTNEPIKLKEEDKFVSYNEIIGGSKPNWPGSAEETTTRTMGSTIGMEGVRLGGSVRNIGLAFYQPPNDERPVVKTKYGTYRIPVDVHYRVETAEGTGNLKGGLATYIELDASGAAISCYKSVSSRSLCLDMDKRFSNTHDPKCY